MRYTNFILFKKIKIRENLKIKNSFQIEIESEKDAQKNFLFFFKTCSVILSEFFHLSILND